MILCLEGIHHKQLYTQSHLSSFVCTLLACTIYTVDRPSKKHSLYCTYQHFLSVISATQTQSHTFLLPPHLSKEALQQVALVLQQRLLDCLWLGVDGEITWVLVWRQTRWQAGRWEHVRVGGRGSSKLVTGWKLPIAWHHIPSHTTFMAVRRVKCF